MIRMVYSQTGERGIHQDYSDCNVFELKRAARMLKRNAITNFIHNKMESLLRLQVIYFLLQSSIEWSSNTSYWTGIAYDNHHGTHTSSSFLS